MSSGRSQRSGGARQVGKAIFRDAILDAAEALFDERGVHAARIQDIAGRAGVAVGTVYNHFEQKEDIVRALMLRHLPVVAALLAPRAEDPADWAGSFRARMGRVHGYVAGHRHFFRMACELGMLGPTAPRMAVDVVNPAHLIEEMIATGVAQGALAGDPVQLTRFLFGAIRGLVEGALVTGSERLREEAALAVDLFLRAVSQPRANDAAQL